MMTEAIYEYYLVGAIPVRITLHPTLKGTVCAEYPDRATGELQIDNLFLKPIETSGEATALTAEEWELHCKNVFGRIEGVHSKT